MRYKIIHQTDYHFNSSIFLEPHYLRFRPKTTPYHKLKAFSLAVSPTSAGIAERFDAENNLVHFCWFEDLHKTLSIRAESIVEVQPHNPFNFLVHPADFLTLPFKYDASYRDLLAPALASKPVGTSLKEYGKHLQKACNSSTVEFITKLTNQIHRDFTVIYREKGAPLSPEETFKRKEGSCRDLTWMQIQLLRQMGIAAKFVSGYFYLEMEKPEFELHAWLEVFLPGAGWIGFDPTHGLLAGETHIPVISSSHFENAMPVTGTIRGDANSEMRSDLFIEQLK